MTRPRIFRFADAVPQPWRNGLGTTRVLMDDSRRGDGWTFRVSVADVVDASPFSIFPGVDRRLLALGPGPLCLTINHREHVVRPLEQLAFAGEDVVRGEPLDGPTRDLNVMTRRGMSPSAITVTNGLRLEPEPAAGVGFIIALGEDCVVGGIALERLDAVALPLESARTQCEGLIAFVGVGEGTAADV